MYMYIYTDIRKLYYQAGVENKPTVFLFTDTQVVEESFLEDINNILSSGEVPSLYKPDEFEEVWWIVGGLSLVRETLSRNFYACAYPVRERGSSAPSLAR